MNKHLTNCGIPGIGIVPYGSHICHFYPSRQELIEAMLPYFVAGVNNNERCLWIASFPLPAAEIRMEIAKSPALENAAGCGQLTILDSHEWYGESATFDTEDIIQRWIGEEESAIAAGHQGLRVNSNTSFFSRTDWRLLMEYEKKLHNRMQKSRIVKCCSYLRDQCRPTDVLEVSRCHTAALDRADQHWQVFLRNSPQPCA